MRALIAACHLMRAPHLRELARLDVLDVSARHRERHFVLRLTGRRAGVTAYAARVVYHFAPLRLLRLSRVNRKLSHQISSARLGHLNLRPVPGSNHFHGGDVPIG